MITIKNGYIEGWNDPTPEEAEKLKIIGQDLTDSYNNLQWKWLDYPKGTPIFQPMELNAEQKEKERSKKIEAEIPYTIQEEIALINKGVLNKIDSDYLDYREKVEAIKLKYPKQ